MKKIILRFILVLLGIFIVIQFIRPAKNQSSATLLTDIKLHYPVPENVQSILGKACLDCHSNNTRYPWYNNIQPVAWFLDDHVRSGKRHLNFSDFTSMRVAKQYKRLEDCKEQIKDGEMPLASYTLIHRDAILSDAEKETLYNWFDAVRDSIKAQYPADSLVMPKRKK
ncbi:MAG: heme-binding domain-containing protein [Bacteroidota bacterium]|jgi:hypothetical protein|nr:heme-binding domain-containing protein [Bacteroidota bacterium]